MKTFAIALASMVAAVANGAAAETKTVFDSNATNNESSGQLVRVTTTTNTVTMLGAGTGVQWDVLTTTRFYEDTGVQKVRLIHDLTMDIAATDQVQFELSFRPESEPAATTALAIGEDFVRCSLTIDSSDSRFWQASIVDGYYTCSNTNDPTDLCKDSDDSQYNENQEASSDWVTPFSDEDASNPWCTTDAVVGSAAPAYACQNIKCYMERPFDTGDTVKDFKITPTDESTPDKLLVQAGRAKLRINPSEFGVAMVNQEDKEILVAQGALSGFATSLSLLAASVAYLSF